MYIYVYIYIHTHIHTHTHTHTHTHRAHTAYGRSYNHACVSVYMYVCTHTYKEMRFSRRTVATTASVSAITCPRVFPAGAAGAAAGAS